MEKWGFQLNASKSVAMIFSRGRISRNIKLDINKTPIQVVNSTTFLGMTLDDLEKTFGKTDRQQPRTTKHHEIYSRDWLGSDN
jgi:hypothetical protein